MTTRTLHPTSLAVWGAPAPTGAGRPFSITVGVRCASGCRLAGLPVVVRDESGAAVGRARLGEAPAPGTQALHAAVVALTAPPAPGLQRWTAEFAGGRNGEEIAGATHDRRADGHPAPADGPPGHAPASAAFSFRTAPPPEHRVEVTVCARGVRAPVARADVRIGIHRAVTGDGGRAVVEVPAGTHDVSVWRVGYQPYAGRIVVAGNAVLRIEADPAADDDLDDDQVWM